MKSVKRAAAKLAENTGITEHDAAILVANGFVTVEGLKAADPETLAAIDGIDQDALKNAVMLLK